MSVEADPRQTLDNSTTAAASAGQAADAAPAGHFRVVQRVVFPQDRDLDVLPLYLDSGSVPSQPPHENAAMPLVKVADSEDALHPQDLIGRRSVLVRPGKRLSFGTYFNAFPAAYWRKWTVVTEVALRVVTEGSGTVVIYRSNARGVTQRVQSSRVEGTQDQTYQLSLAPFGDGGWYWFDLIADADGMSLTSADWSVPTAGRGVGKLGIGVTTFNRADYCNRTIAAIAADPDLRAVLSEMVIVDQGNEKVANVEGFGDLAADMGDQLRIIDQANLGGSGGFARNMYEAVRSDTSDYVLLLDDDVQVETEGIIRAAAFADMCRVPTIVGGHMFDMFDRSVLHAYAESINMWRFWWGTNPGLYQRHNLASQNLRATPWMHRRWDVDYNGWWMCLIPTQVVREIGLSLPVFIKWDDAEYGLRAKAAGFPTVSMPGVAVWHVSWLDKDDSVDWQAYFHARNRIVAALLHSPYANGGALIRESLAIDVKHILSMQYYAESAHIMALKDVLEGPGHLHPSLASRAAQLRSMKADFPDATIEKDPGAFPAPRQKRPPRRGEEPSKPNITGVLPWTVKTLLKQTWAPASQMSKKNPEANVMNQDSKWWRLSQYDSAVVSSADGTGASWYQRDNVLARRLMTESISLHLKLRAQWKSLSRQYRQALPDFTSQEQWAATFEAAQAPESPASEPQAHEGGRK